MILVNYSVEGVTLMAKGALKNKCKIIRKSLRITPKISASILMAQMESSSRSNHIPPAESMTSFRLRMDRVALRRRACRRAAILRRCFGRLLDRCLLCSSNKSCRYRVASIPSLTSPSPAAYDGDGFDSGIGVPTHHNFSQDLDLVELKISVLGDSEIGKTSFLEKYVGNEIEKIGTKSRGLNLMDKTLMVGGARLSYSLWEVGGDKRSEHHIPVACKDSVAIFFMFDLTSRCTLNSVMRWYHQARKWNQTGILIMIGSKYDDFIQLPIDLQRTIVSQARAYARAINATLFFSSAAYNINVNKIFKFITAKLFDLPWTVERNLNIGEPIIDY